MPKINFLNILLWSSLFLLILSADVIFEEKTIEDMKSSLWNSNSEGFYHLTEKLIDTGETIIALTSLDKSNEGSKGYTDIITYKHENNTSVYKFYLYIYDKEKLKFEKKKDNNDKEEVLIIDDSKIASVRNLFVGKFGGKNKCYLASFNRNDNKEELIHYIQCENEIPQQIEDIKSNIIILNRKSNNEDNQIVYQDTDNFIKICVMGTNYRCKKEKKNEIKDVGDWKLSLKGGLAYVDIDGNCSPDIILSLDKGKFPDIKRVIQIYTSNRKVDDSYSRVMNISIGNASEFGPFTISRINNEIAKDDDTEYAPQFDILIPKLYEKKILVYKNKVRRDYKWDKYYCKEDEYLDPISDIFEDRTDYDLVDDDQLDKLDDSYITVIRPGDFLSSGIPGLLIQEKLKDGQTAISLYEKPSNENKFKLYLRVTGGDIGNPKFGIFFDINESGSLGLIVQNDKLENHFIYNYRKNNFFVKAKLMNDKGDYYDINVGASFRYIVTDADTVRKMDVSYQLAQTSDMNIPVPFSLKGLGETSNYVENFQIISGNHYYDKKLFDDDKRRNFRDQTPIVPNTQMAAFKFMNKDDDDHLYEWYLDLFVSPTESLLIIALVIVAVMLIILGVIIYLHVREVKEEQKETNKFKSWFA